MGFEKTETAIQYDFPDSGVAESMTPLPIWKDSSLFVTPEIVVNPRAHILPTERTEGATVYVSDDWIPPLKRYLEQEEILRKMNPFEEAYYEVNQRLRARYLGYPESTVESDTHTSVAPSVLPHAALNIPFSGKALLIASAFAIALAGCTSKPTKSPDTTLPPPGMTPEIEPTLGQAYHDLLALSPSGAELSSVLSQRGITNDCKLNDADYAALDAIGGLTFVSRLTEIARVALENTDSTATSLSTFICDYTEGDAAATPTFEMYFTTPTDGYFIPSREGVLIPAKLEGGHVTADIPAPVAEEGSAYPDAAPFYEGPSGGAIPVELQPFVTIENADLRDSFARQGIPNIEIHTVWHGSGNDFAWGSGITNNAQTIAYVPVNATTGEVEYRIDRRNETLKWSPVNIPEGVEGKIEVAFENEFYPVYIFVSPDGSKELGWLDLSLNNGTWVDVKGNPITSQTTPTPEIRATQTIQPTVEATDIAPIHIEVDLDTVEVIPRWGAATYGLEAKYRDIDLSYEHFITLNQEAGFDTATYPYSYKGPSAERELPYITAVFIDAYRKVSPGGNSAAVYKIGVFGPEGLIVVESVLTSVYNSLESYPDILSHPVACVRWNSSVPVEDQSPQLVENTTQFCDINALLNNTIALRGQLMMISVAKLPNSEENATKNAIRYFTGEPSILSPPPFTTASSNGFQGGGYAFFVPTDTFEALLYKP